MPIFVPFAFSNLDWNAYPHIQLLAASTNFIVHDAPTFESGNTTKRLDDLLLSMHGAGLPVDLPERLIKSDANEIVLNGTVTNGPHEQLLAITESLRAFATSIQAFANVTSEKEREREREMERKKYFDRKVIATEQYKLLIESLNAIASVSTKVKNERKLWLSMI